MGFVLLDFQHCGYCLLTIACPITNFLVAIILPVLLQIVASGDPFVKLILSEICAFYSAITISV
jgi:hypothetical protein